MKHRPARRTGWMMAAGILLLGTHPVVAQDPAVGGLPWEMEKLHLTEGRVLAGFVETEWETAVQFIEVHRPAGKPMYLVVRTVPRDRIAKIERLDETARRHLQERLHSYRNRARIEARREEAVELRAIDREGHSWWEYRAKPWFQFATTLDEPIARRIAVRLDQIFQAYKQVLPSRTDRPPNPLSIVVYGQRDAYVRSLARQGIRIMNPAFFEPDKNRVLAGCAIHKILDGTEAARQSHKKIEQQLNQWELQFQESYQHHKHALRNASKAERDRILKALRDRWAQEKKETKRKIKETELQNEKILEAEINDLVRLLFHESLHAYLDNFVYHRDQYDVPRWLNEGLAQIFEDARIEADLLRIDAPNPTRLSQLRAELNRADRLTLRELLSADSAVFLIPHSSQAESSNRHYLFAWGVVYYLIFEQPFATSERLDAYVARDPATTGKSNNSPAQATAHSKESADSQAIEQFERLVGQPIDAFEATWKEAMLTGDWATQ